MTLKERTESEGTDTTIRRERTGPVHSVEKQATKENTGKGE